MQMVLDASGRVVYDTVLSAATFGIEEAHITEAPERCDPTDKWSPVTCDDKLPTEIANNDKYTPEFIIPRGIGYYHKRDWEIDDESRGEVVLAMANPTSVEEIVRIQWLAGDEPPLAALVPPTEVVRVRFPRPRCAEIDGVPIPVAGLDMLRVENRGQVRRITTSPEVIGASVGGNSFVAFTPPLDLVTVATGARSAATPIPRTLAALRPRLEGWEIFVEARGFAQSSTLPDPRAIRDAIEIVGPAGASITVRSDGSVDDPTDALEGLGGVRFRTFSDRYRIGFTVPPAWIDRSGGRTIVTLGFRRRLDGVFFDAPLAVVPWREVPRTIDIDILSRE